MAATEQSPSEPFVKTELDGQHSLALVPSAPTGSPLSNSSAGEPSDQAVSKSEDAKPLAREALVAQTRQSLEVLLRQAMDNLARQGIDGNTVGVTVNRLLNEYSLLYAAAEFAGLPPLPPRLPVDTSFRHPHIKRADPHYLRQFYRDCTAGRLEKVKRCVERRRPAANFVQFGTLCAAEAGRAGVVGYLLRNGARLTDEVLTKAASAPSVELFKIFVEEHHWHPNQGTETSRVALPIVVKHGGEDVVRYLLDQGADPNLGKHWGRWPGEVPIDRRSGAALNAAAAWSSPGVFALLLDRGAQLERATPIHEAAHAHSVDNNRTAIIRYLLDIGVDINGVDAGQVKMRFRRGTPLWTCIADRRQEGVELLLEAGACPYTAWEPEWYPNLVRKVKQRKGDRKFWDDIRKALAPTLPHWTKPEGPEIWMLRLASGEDKIPWLA